MNRGFLTTAVVLAAAVLGVHVDLAHAQAWPTRPIRTIVNFAPGGPVDVVIRMMAPAMQSVLGQPLVVENRAGAGGNIGTDAVAKSPPDGYTLLGTSSAFAVNPSLTPDAGYDPEKDFVPVAIIARQPNLILVNPSVPANTLAELIALVKKGKYAYASPGSGTTPHLTAENLFRVLARADVPAVHFRGAGPAAAAVVAGEPAIGSFAATAAMPFIKSGKLRALAISSQQRSPVLPDVPTFAEAGYPTIKDYTWVALLAPAGTPPEVVQKLNDAVNQVLRLPDVRAGLDKFVFDEVGGSPKDFADYLHSEIAHWADVVKATGARLE
jgi:tripartite-type tricarboxylate transporter receptor subunit TctC